MSASSSGAIKAFLEGQRLGLSVYRVPETLPPYVSVDEAIALVPDSLEDGGVGQTATETCQVTVWQRWRDKSSGKLAEDPLMARAVVRVLHGARLVTSPTLTYIVLVRNALRKIDENENVVGVYITAEIKAVL